jgi:hypothetical protein
MTAAVPGGVKIFLLNHGQVKHLTFIFISSTKKGDVTKHKQLHHFLMQIRSSEELLKNNLNRI